MPRPALLLVLYVLSLLTAFLLGAVAWEAQRDAGRAVAVARRAADRQAACVDVLRQCVVWRKDMLAGGGR